MEVERDYGEALRVQGERQQQEQQAQEQGSAAPTMFIITDALV